MAKTKTLLQIRTSVATEGAYERSSDITAAVLNDYINKAIVRGREILVKARRDYFTVVSDPFTVAAGTQAYALPDDFEHLRKVEISTDGGTRWHKLSPVDLDDTERHQSPTSRRYRYRLQGSATPLALHPTPGASTDQIRVWYIPYATELVNDTDSITINVDAEYELYVALALCRCKKREDLEPDEVEVADIVARITSMAEDRDDNEPFYLSDRRNLRNDECDW